MKNWTVSFMKDAAEERNHLDASARNQVDKAIRKVSQNPLPRNEGGYGSPLGNKHGINLTGCCKIKLKGIGIRVVYKLLRDGGVMRIIVIAARADEEVYEVAANRMKRFSQGGIDL